MFPPSCMLLLDQKKLSSGSSVSGEFDSVAGLLWTIIALQMQVGRQTEIRNMLQRQRRRQKDIKSAVKHTKSDRERKLETNTSTRSSYFTIDSNVTISSYDVYHHILSTRLMNRRSARDSNICTVENILEALQDFEISSRIVSNLRQFSVEYILPLN